MKPRKKATVSVWLRSPPLELDRVLLSLRPSIPERYKERWQLLCSHANTRVGLRDCCVTTGFASLTLRSGQSIIGRVEVIHRATRPGNVSDVLRLTAVF
jgi:hypothetical protein